MIAVGTVLEGFCGGCFGRDSYHDKRVEAVGADWVVARVIDCLRGDTPEFYAGDLSDLEPYVRGAK